jgi:flavin-dependent dehydrogenase
VSSAEADVHTDSHYDVVILGGGLSGHTLALQLKRVRPETSVLIAERRGEPAPEAAFKVGESTVEISAHYFSEVVGMEEHLETEQLKKAGLRYFFPAGDNEDITARFEWGPAQFAPKVAYQLDRGRFENALWEASEAAGVHVLAGSTVDDVYFGEDEHTVVLSHDGSAATEVKTRWVVGATGRAGVIRRKLGLEREVGHRINASWFRLAGGIHISDWSDDPEWQARVASRSVRDQSTNHLMGEGYWVWLIPLVSGPVSIGIVADPRFHPYERINTLDSALEWLRAHEPQLGAIATERQAQVEDFLTFEHFSYGCERVYSPDRWALSGEAGVFLDPLYSPGSDFIATGNTFISDLVTRDLNGEDIGERLEFYNGHLLQLFNAYLGIYTDHYAEFGNQHVMSMKLWWDFSIYWSITSLRFVNNKLTDLPFTQAILPHLGLVFQMTARMQQLFRDWHRLSSPKQGPGFVGTNNVPLVHEKHGALNTTVDDDDELKAMFAANAEFLRALAVLIFHEAVRSLSLPAIDASQPINPLAVSVDPERWTADGLFDDAGLSLERARQIAPGVNEQWLGQPLTAA